LPETSRQATTPEGAPSEKGRRFAPGQWGESTWTKRDKSTGKFVDQKKAPAKKKFNGIGREKKSG
jgi:hypothetical protein